MPTYEYRCGKCGNFECFQRITDAALTSCPHCGGGEVKRLLSLSSFQLKGSGWYKTDYASSSSNGTSAVSKTNGSSNVDASSETISKNIEKSSDSAVPKESKSDTSTATTGTTSSGASVATSS